jgi:DedD protein
MAGNRPARERFEFSLDARQVAAVILGSLASLGLAFFLGHVLGQRVGEHPAPVARQAPPSAPPSDPLAALDQAPRPDGGDAHQPLSFHEALTSARPPADKLPAAPRPHPPSAAAPAATASATPAATAAAALAPSGPARSATAPAPGAASGTPGPETARAPAGAAAPPGTPAAAPTGPTGPTGTKVAAEAVAKPSAAPPVPAARPAAPPSRQDPVKGGWTIQVHATQDRFDADRVAARLASRGARVTAADVPGKGRWYRVRLGSYESREAAERALKDLQRSGAARGFVTPAG